MVGIGKGDSPAKPAELAEIAPRAERVTAVDPGEVDAIQNWIENTIRASSNRRPRRGSVALELGLVLS